MKSSRHPNTTMPARACPEVPHLHVSLNASRYGGSTRNFCLHPAWQVVTVHPPAVPLRFQAGDCTGRLLRKKWCSLPKLCLGPVYRSRCRQLQLAQFTRQERQPWASSGPQESDFIFQSWARIVCPPETLKNAVPQTLLATHSTGLVSRSWGKRNSTSHLASPPASTHSEAQDNN